MPMATYLEIGFNGSNVTLLEVFEYRIDTGPYIELVSRHKNAPAGESSLKGLFGERLALRRMHQGSSYAAWKGERETEFPTGKSKIA